MKGPTLEDRLFREVLRLHMFPPKLPKPIREALVRNRGASTPSLQASEMSRIDAEVMSRRKAAVRERFPAATQESVDAAFASISEILRSALRLSMLADDIPAAVRELHGRFPTLPDSVCRDAIVYVWRGPRW